MNRTNPLTPTKSLAHGDTLWTRRSLMYNCSRVHKSVILASRREGMQLQLDPLYGANAMLQFHNQQHAASCCCSTHVQDCLAVPISAEGVDQAQTRAPRHWPAVSVDQLQCPIHAACRRCQQGQAENKRQAGRTGVTLRRRGQKSEVESSPPRGYSQACFSKCISKRPLLRYMPCMLVHLWNSKARRRTCHPPHERRHTYGLR